MGRQEEVLSRWEAAADRLDWNTRWEVVHRAVHGSDTWFAGAQTNVCANALDRHLPARRDAVALLWEGEPGDRRCVTYGVLHREVCTLASALRAMGIGRGDAVGLHLGLVPEAVVAMLACARIGAVYAVLPSVLPAEALSDRLQDLQPRVLVTQDGAWRHGVILPLKARADEALSAVSSVQHTIVVRRTGIDVAWYEGDRWYHELVAAPRRDAPDDDRIEAPPPQPADAPLFITYLANRRGRPTGVVHGTAGWMTYCHTMHVDGLTRDATDLVWAPMELGWLAMQAQGILGPMLAGAATVLYEGMIDTPHHGRAWEIIERYGVTTLVATASVLRALRQWPDAPPEPVRLATLRRIISAGEPIDSGMLDWLRAEVGGGRATVADAWGQTELGGIVTVDPPQGRGVPDIGLAIVDTEGREVPPGTVGDLIVTLPWPGTALGLHDGGVLPGHAAGAGPYMTGDRARRRPDGTVEFLGRRDHVFNVSGQLVSEAEVRQALEHHPFVARAEVVDRPARRTGRAVVAALQLVPEARATDALATELTEYIRQTLGGLAVPKTVLFIEQFPAELRRHQLRQTLQRLAASAGPLQHVGATELLSEANRGVEPRT